MKCYKMKAKTNSISFVSSIPDPFGAAMVWSRSAVDIILFENKHADVIRRAREEASKNSGWLNMLWGRK